MYQARCPLARVGGGGLHTAATLASTNLPLTFTTSKLNDRQPTRGWLHANETGALAAGPSSSLSRANRKCRLEGGRARAAMKVARLPQSAITGGEGDVEDCAL